MSELFDVLAPLVKAVLSEPKFVLARRPPPDVYLAHPCWRDTSAGQALLDAFKSLPELARYEDEMLCFAGSGIRVYHHEWIGWILARSFEVGSDQSVAEFGRFVLSDTVPIISFVAISRARTHAEIEFHDGARLCDVAALPDPLTVTNLAGSGNEHFATGDIRSILFQYSFVQKSFGDEQRMEPVKFRHLRDIALCLSLARPLEFDIQIPFGSVTTPPEVPSTEFGLSQYIFPHQSPNLQPPILAIEANKAKTIYTVFDAIADDVKDRLRIPMKRINDYASSTAEDSLIDLRVALESLFLADGNKEQLGHRLSQRAALFLGDTFEKRVEIQNEVKKAYGETSYAVHNGTASEKTDWKLIDRVASHARTAIIKQIELAQPVDWQQVELGDRPFP